MHLNIKILQFWKQESEDGGSESGDEQPYYVLRPSMKKWKDDKNED